MTPATSKTWCFCVSAMLMPHSQAAMLMNTKLTLLVLLLIPSAGLEITSAHQMNVTHGAKAYLANSHSAAMHFVVCTPTYLLISAPLNFTLSLLSRGRWPQDLQAPVRRD